ncbi:hypothetical protein H5085_01500 [Pseudoalteromonas sp. SR43-6]|uniref:hypothetical protein n=1 Tax=Pseudoalteromonas TaxID=53246 RepID=UPI0015F9128A|nr:MULTISPECIES: hypothetical protein [Pseudoalteromonas]MBB1287846.1 hypothetical protein [Pseudoalteromonas sp. SR41-5]MBB1373024.1 hypothetical protein [Pseudoalteromonas sp. SR43-6]MBB1380300.1 hypothetical protein [Pseudoalteromonas sp. SR43-2]MBB1412487.1 hypothetical protein [Pseudoalteromonas sp. SG43-8]MBD0409313.1 hypothetical protein [Pseudoalteromonas distincta]
MKFLTLTFLILFSTISLAKLAPSKWSDLIHNSEFIVYGVAQEIKITDLGTGQAKYKIIESIKGKYTEKYITVHWSSEVHDQRVYEINTSSVLFVKKDSKGNYVGTSYGRSFWKVNIDYSNRENSYINLFGSLGLVQDTPESITEYFYPERCGEITDYKARKINLNKLIQYISESY